MTIGVENQEKRTAAGARNLPSGHVRGEYAALRQGCGVYPLAQHAKLALTGNDRVRWLNGMVTNNIRDLAAGHGVYAFLLNPQGHILADMYAYNRGDSLLVDTAKSQVAKVQEIFDHYIIMDDVEIADLSGQIAGLRVTGPDSRRILGSAEISVPELEPLQFVELSWQQKRLTVVRGEVETGESFDFWTSPEDTTRLNDRLVAVGANAVGEETIELYRIACGIPLYGQDIRERDLPQETTQARALHFSKGCYVGQEIVERIRSRGSVHRQFSKFRVEGPLPALGTKIQSSGKDVGEITSSAVLPEPEGDRATALGYIRKEASLPGQDLKAGEARLELE